MNFSLHITSLWGKSFDAYPLDSKADYLKYLSTDGDGSNIAVSYAPIRSVRTFF